MKKILSKIICGSLVTMLIITGISEPLYAAETDFEGVSVQEEILEESVSEEGKSSETVPAENIVCTIGENGYSSLVEAVNAASNGDTILLLENVTLEKTNASDSRYGLWIEKSLTIDGQGYTIDVGTYGRGIGIKGSTEEAEKIDVVFRNVKVTSAIGLGRAVDTRGGYFCLKLENAMLETTGTGNTQALTIGGSHQNLAKIEVLNSEIKAGDAGYGIITFNPVDVTIDHSKISGYAALYMREADSSVGSVGSKVKIQNQSWIMGFNCHPKESGSSFGTIYIVDKDITIEVTGSTIGSQTTNTATEAIISFKYDKDVNGCVNISENSKIILDGKAAMLYKGNANDFKLSNANIEILNGASDKMEEEWKSYIPAEKIYQKTETGYVIGDAAAEITLDQKELLLKEKETAVLKASVAPENALDKTVTWSTSNEAVATVKDGEIQAIAAGTCEITAAVGNVKAVCKVTVYAVEEPEAPQLDTSKPVEDVTVGLETEQSEIIQTNVNQIIESVVSGEETSQISTETKNNIEEALKDGSTIETKVLIELKEMEEIKQEDILKIESITGEKAVVAQYLNLEIKLMAGNKELGTIEEIREPMTFTIMIPEELKAEGRTFFVVRIHEGEAEKLPVNTNPDGTISFKTDKFSTYALAYEDKEKIENQESESDKGHLGSTDKPQENNENNTNQSNPVQQSSNPEYTESVKTGDPLNMMNVVGLIVLMAVALTLFIILMKKRMIKK